MYLIPALLLAATVSAQPADRFKADVAALAAENMEGRGLGTRGLELAAGYLEKRLRETGLAPAFGRSYRQSFRVKTGVSAGDENRLDGVASDAWSPLGMSSPGSFQGELVFAGYGIHAPPIGYGDFDGVDVKGKVVLMLRYEPQERDDASPFDGRRPSRWSAMRYKVLQARERGAVAVIFATGPLQDEGKDRIAALANDGPESPAGIPVLQIRTSVAQEWLKSDLLQFQKDVDRDLRPRPRTLGRAISGTVDVRPQFADAVNLAAVLPGKGSLANEVVVLGAHYDHLGWGGQGSMKPNARAIHFGADDNASGTAGVLAAAGRLRAELRGAKQHRTIAFVLFSGEERGLAGSGHFVAHPPFAMERIVAMVNLDMIGQLRDEKLMALGTESAGEWKALVEQTAAATNLKVISSGDGYGPSDQTSFYAKQIPVLHFFTGAHDRYHTPDDTADSVNYDGALRVVDFTSRIVGALARNEVTPRYARAGAAPAMQGDSRGYGAYLGTVPDYGAMNETTGGVLLSDVRPGSPAEKAGIKGGDRLVEIGGTKIENLYDMTFALQDHKPGATVDLVVLRGGERVTLPATLSSRGAAAAPSGATASSPARAAEGAAPPKDAFYADRPGKTFAIKAGKPFEASFEGEKHFRDIRQLTFGGENAEAYFSPDGKKLIYQATVPGAGCDQQYVIDLESGETTRVSNGKGRTTCGYFDWPEADAVIYASTAGSGDECPAPPDRSRGYVWKVDPNFDIYVANADGSSPRRLTSTPGYDAEATWCHRGGKIVFTSVRDGDLDLYEMDEAGNVRRLTSTPGYDGGAFYSPDCREIVWRARYPAGEELDDYRKLLAEGLVRPSRMEIFLMNADGSGARPLTSNGAANFCPYFHPDGKRIIYASNASDPRGREFDLWMIDKNGGEPERITFAPGFDGFPMFSPDGEFVVWASNRADPQGRETNLFVARWAD